MNPRNPSLIGGVRRGLGWGIVNSLVMRSAALVLGIVIARLLSPQEFGVYAVALVALSVLVSVADLGLSAELIRRMPSAQHAATVTTLALISGCALSMLMVAFAEPMAAALGSADAAPVIRLMSGALLLGSLGVAPFAQLQREFRQRAIFGIELASFATSAVVTIALLANGGGVEALGWARLAAQSVTTTMQFVLTRSLPRLGWDRSVVRGVLAFGLPVGGANLLSWVLMNVDYVIVGRTAGTTALGFYVLAFNVSNWPVSAIAQTVRSVALAAFARLGAAASAAGLPSAVALTWTAGLFVGGALAVLATPVVLTLYGDTWRPAAPALAVLGLFGALRVVLDLFATLLYARGASRPVLAVQALWITVLVPAMVVGASTAGLVGAGIAHLVVGFGVVLPVYLWLLLREGASLAALGRAAAPPVMAALPAAAVMWVVAQSVEPAAVAVFAGGAVGGLTFIALLHRWLRMHGQRLKRLAEAQDAHGASGDLAPVV